VTRDKFTPFLKLRKGRSKAGDAAAIWYIVHPAEDGIRKKWKPLPLRGPAAEPKARQVLAEFIRRREATVTLAGGGDDGGPMTVARWAPKWIESRVAKGNQAPEFYQSCLEHHIVPYLGHLRLDAVKPEHIEGLMAELARKGLAPKTRRNIYFAAHAMFQKAVPRLIAVNPCSLDEEDLPRRIDKDPEWRATAIFEPFEVEMLVYDHRIPFDRRVFYAISFLAGPRFGEVSALHHRHYLPELLPLGQLQVGLSYNSKKKKLGPTKGKKPRKVPVHPALKAILRQWLETGFREFMGRHWRPDDPLVPARWWKTRTIPTRPAPVVLRHRPYHTMWKRFQADLETLGLRPRRQHDDRRTFITMARAHGAQKDLLRLVTHGAEGDIIDVYSEIPWGSLCAEVAKLRLGAGAGDLPGARPGGAGGAARRWCCYR
jgi:integrase